jgi:hypothetical protein
VIALLAPTASARAQVTVRPPGVRPSCAAGLELGVRYDRSTGSSPRHVAVTVRSGSKVVYRRELTATAKWTYWTIHPACGHSYVITYVTVPNIVRIPVTLARSVAGATAARATTGFSAPQTVSGGGLAEQPQVAVGAGGRTLAVWNDQPLRHRDYNLPKGHIDARLGSAGATFGPTETLTTSGTSPLAAVGSDSVAAVAWGTERANRAATIYVSIARPGHDFGRARALASGVGVGGSLGEPSGVEVQPDGRVVVIWARGVRSPPPFSAHAGLDYALIEPDGTEQHGSIGAVIGPASVAQASDGTVLVAASAYPTDAAEAATLVAGGSAFAGPQTIPAPAGGVGAAGQPGAFAGDGGAAVAFEVDENQPSLLLGLSLLGPSETFGPEVLATGPALSGDSDGVEGPVAALPGDGAQVEAYTVEQTNDPAEGEIVAAQVIAAVRPGGAASFGAPVQLSSGAGIPSGPLSASAGATTAIIWGQPAGCREQVYSAVRPAGGAFGPATRLGPRFEVQGVLCGHGGGGQLSIAGAGRYVLAAWLQSDQLRSAVLIAP